MHYQNQVQLLGCLYLVLKYLRFLEPALFHNCMAQAGAGLNFSIAGASSRMISRPDRFSKVRFLLSRVILNYFELIKSRFSSHTACGQTFLRQGLFVFFLCPSLATWGKIEPVFSACFHFNSSFSSGHTPFPLSSDSGLLSLCCPVKR